MKHYFFLQQISLLQGFWLMGVWNKMEKRIFFTLVSFRPNTNSLKISGPPFWGKKKFFINRVQNEKLELMVSTTKIAFEKYALDPELLVKMCQNWKVWLGRSKSNTFLLISWDPRHIFQNQFFC